jgi:hypothetical protein
MSVYVLIQALKFKIKSFMGLKFNSIFLLTKFHLYGILYLTKYKGGMFMKLKNMLACLTIPTFLAILFTNDEILLLKIIASLLTIILLQFFKIAVFVDDEISDEEDFL